MLIPLWTWLSLVICASYFVEKPTELIQTQFDWTRRDMIRVSATFGFHFEAFSWSRFNSTGLDSIRFVCSQRINCFIRSKMQAHLWKEMDDNLRLLMFLLHLYTSHPSPLCNKTPFPSLLTFLPKNYRHKRNKRIWSVSERVSTETDGIFLNLRPLVQLVNMLISVKWRVFESPIISGRSKVDDFSALYRELNLTHSSNTIPVCDSRACAVYT